MKVMLLVEREGRVVCYETVPKRLPAIHKSAREWARNRVVTGRRRWWLVEAESADAARFLIDPALTNERCSWPPPQGRILASGGREA